MERPFIIHFQPPKKCYHATCSRLADLAICEQWDGGSFRADACCPEHIYFFSSVEPGEEEIKEQHEVIALMLKAYYHAEQATVEHKAKLEEIADYPLIYDPYMNIDDEAWLCRYQPTNGGEQAVYVVWSYSALDWFLYPAALEQSSLS